jgi:hypothetical protein
MVPPRGRQREQRSTAVVRRVRRFASGDRLARPANVPFTLADPCSAAHSFDHLVRAAGQEQRGGYAKRLGPPRREDSH